MVVKMAASILGAWILLVQLAEAQRSTANVFQIRATADADLRSWDAFTTRLSRDGALRLRSVERDPAMPGRAIERLDQFHNGVRIWGADIVRDSEAGVAKSIFGSIELDVVLATEPGLSSDEARSALMAVAQGEATMQKPVELLIVRLDSGELRLAYTAVIADASGVARVFVDAHRGVELLRISEIQTQAAVGIGRGVLGDQKKLSVLRQGATFVTDDQHRPPVLRTYDFRGDFGRALSVVARGVSLNTSDLASDSDNDWNDPVSVDAHVHVGWTYDYFFKRFERRGLDNRDRPVIVLTNGLTPQAALSAAPGDFFTFATNAFWCGACGPAGIGVMYFGSGIPAGFFLISSGQNWEPTVGSIDIVGHELTHGVTDSSSRLIARGESGALNEAFSDMMGTAVEFFYHPTGLARGQADYLIGEDTVRGVRPGTVHGIRSLDNPSLHRNPDHYNLRSLSVFDIHRNSTIPSHAFYLAIEGGTNRTSGLSVQGVGAANREQIERVFYRAFVFLLPSNATFSIARAATIQAARDLYGPGSAAERAVTEAWTAVGVN